MKTYKYSCKFMTISVTTTNKFNARRIIERELFTHGYSIVVLLSDIREV